jgi:hypothetical protein
MSRQLSRQVHFFEGYAKKWETFQNHVGGVYFLRSDNKMYGLNYPTRQAAIQRSLEWSQIRYDVVNLKVIGVNPQLKEFA